MREEYEVVKATGGYSISDLSKIITQKREEGLYLVAVSLPCMFFRKEDDITEQVMGQSSIEFWQSQYQHSEIVIESVQKENMRLKASLGLLPADDVHRKLADEMERSEYREKQHAHAIFLLENSIAEHTAIMAKLESLRIEITSIRVSLANRSSF